LVQMPLVEGGLCRHSDGRDGWVLDLSDNAVSAAQRDAPLVKRRGVPLIHG
jgi:hypothetical protein